MLLGERLQRLRRSHQLTLGDLARPSQGPSSTISALETKSQRRETTSIAVVLRLAERLRVRLDDPAGRYTDVDLTPPDQELLSRVAAPRLPKTPPYTPTPLHIFRTAKHLTRAELAELTGIGEGVLEVLELG